MNRESILAYHILSHIDKDRKISQRKLSKRIGLNISSINFALRKLISKGLIRMHGMNPRRITYHLTPKGLREKTQLAYRYFLNNYHLYHDIRSDILSKINKIDKSNGKRVVIYGLTPFLEITYTILMEHGFEIVGILDNEINEKEDQGLKYSVKDITELKISNIDYVVELKDIDDGLRNISSIKKQPFELKKRIKLFYNY